MTPDPATVALEDLVKAATRERGFIRGTGRFTLCWECGGYEPDHDPACFVLRWLAFADEEPTDV